MFLKSCFGEQAGVVEDGACQGAVPCCCAAGGDALFEDGGAIGVEVFQGQRCVLNGHEGVAVGADDGFVGELVEALRMGCGVAVPVLDLLVGAVIGIARCGHLDGQATVADAARVGDHAAGGADELVVDGEAMLMSQSQTIS